MLKDDAVEELIRTAIGSVFAGHDVQSVSIEPSVDWTGEDSLRFIVIVGDDEANRPGPDTIAGLDNLVRRRLTSDGDMRMPFVHVYTRADLEEDVESES